MGRRDARVRAYVEKTSYLLERVGDVIGSGSPEASFSAARSCLRLPRASASLGQSAAWAALAPGPYPAYFRHRWEGEGLTEAQRGAVEAVARNEPRPGHSVLGVGTFEAAKSAFNPNPDPDPEPEPSPSLALALALALALTLALAVTLSLSLSLTRRPSPPSRRLRCGSPRFNLSTTPTPSAPPSAEQAPR